MDLVVAARRNADVVLASSLVARARDDLRIHRRGDCRIHADRRAELDRGKRIHRPAAYRTDRPLAGGRVAFAIGDTLPIEVLMVAELLFVPGVIIVLAPSIMRSSNRNWPLLLVLFGFWCGDVVFAYAALSGQSVLASTALRGSLDVVLILITIIGGRIIPTFTGNALRARGAVVTMRSSRSLEVVVIALTVGYVLADIAAPFAKVTGVAAAAAALAHFLRLSGWHGLRSWREPIVWILHAGYAWLPIGLALKAIFVLAGASWAAHWQHALGAGAAGTMIMAVMTRASLGHTGRPLHVSRLIVVAYAMLIASVILRVFGATVPATGIRINDNDSGRSLDCRFPPVQRRLCAHPHKTARGWEAGLSISLITMVN